MMIVAGAISMAGLCGLELILYDALFLHVHLDPSVARLPLLATGVGGIVAGAIIGWQNNEAK